MFLTREQLVGKKCLNEESLGIVDGLVIDYKRVALAAILLNKSGLFARQMAIPLANIADITQDQIRVSGKEPVNPKKRYNNPERYGEIIKKPVYTKQKKYLGQVATYKINTQSGLLRSIWTKTPIHLRALWKNILLIDREAVINIGPEKIIVEDSIVKDLSRQSGKQALGKLYDFGQAETELIGNNPAHLNLNGKNNE